MITEYGGKEKYASKEEQKKHEANEKAKKESEEKMNSKQQAKPTPSSNNGEAKTTVKQQASANTQAPSKKIVLGKSNVDEKDMHRTDNQPVGKVGARPSEKELKVVAKDSKKKILLAKKTEGPKNAEGRTAAQEKEYMDEMNEQIRMGKESDERFKKSPVGLLIESKKAENKGDMKKSRKLYEAAKKAGLITKSL